MRYNIKCTRSEQKSVKEESRQCTFCFELFIVEWKIVRLSLEIICKFQFCENYYCWTARSGYVQADAKIIGVIRVWTFICFKQLQAQPWSETSRLLCVAAVKMMRIKSSVCCNAFLLQFSPRVPKHFKERLVLWILLRFACMLEESGEQ
jgi:hypothetical protein